MILLLIAFLIILVGLYGMLIGKNMISTIISLNIVQTAVVLMFVFLSSGSGEGLPMIGGQNINPVDPLPQALMITAIVIGASTTALALMMTIKIFHYYGSLEWKDILNRRVK